jgi:hypothetical protein
MGRMFVLLAIAVPVLFLAAFIALVISRYKRLRSEHQRQMRVYAREIGEIERLGPASGEILFGQQDERAD